MGLLRLAGVAARLEGEDQAFGDPFAARFRILGANDSAISTLDPAACRAARDGGQTSPLPHTDAPGVLCRGALGDCCLGRHPPLMNAETRDSLLGRGRALSVASLAVLLAVLTFTLLAFIA